MIDQLVQLHEQLNIHYMVDCYEARLITGDGHKLVLVGRGETVAGAILDLEQQAESLGVTDCRGVRMLLAIRFLE